LKGELPQHTKELHEYYGEVVRIAPDELSYNSAQAYEDINSELHLGIKVAESNKRPLARRYKHLKGGFEKDMTWHSQSINSIPVIVRNSTQYNFSAQPSNYSKVTAKGEDHSRLRRILAFAFSERALSSQEGLIRAQVDILISHLIKEVEVAEGNVINIYPWLSSATMDIISDLSFGRSLGCLESTTSQEPHPWVKMIAGHMKQGLYVQAWRRLPAFISRSSLASAVLGRMSSQWKKQFQMTSQLAKERVASGATDRQDFSEFAWPLDAESATNMPSFSHDAR
jgi:aspirochlorine biosynthesis cytochrome P450 monooxygenase